IEGASYDVNGVQVIAPHHLAGSGDNERESKVTTNGAGTAIVYTDYTTNSGDIFLRIVDSTGAAGSPVAVNSQVTAGAQITPDIPELANGKMPVVWFDSANNEIKYHMFNSNGTSGSAELVAGTVSGGVTGPTVTALADGGFVVSWIGDGLQFQADPHAR